MFSISAKATLQITRVPPHAQCLIMMAIVTTPISTVSIEQIIMTSSIFVSDIADLLSRNDEIGAYSRSQKVLTKGISIYMIGSIKTMCQSRIEKRKREVSLWRVSSLSKEMIPRANL